MRGKNVINNNYIIILNKYYSIYLNCEEKNVLN